MCCLLKDADVRDGFMRRVINGSEHWQQIFWLETTLYTDDDQSPDL